MAYAFRILGLTLCVGMFSVFAVAAEAQTRRKMPESLVTTTEQSGMSRVIVQVAAPSQGGRQEAFRVPERHVEQVLGNAARSPVLSLGDIPFVVTTVTAEGLARLERDQSVYRVFPDMAMKASLSESTEVIQAPPVWQGGDRGDGIGVAVIDSGVRRDHPFLKNKVVAEACFSSTSESVKATTLCPNGKDEEIAAGAARDCGPRDDPGGCGHGTHVAGIIAGADGRADKIEKTLNGVAPRANIIAVKVFSRIDGAQCGAGVAFCMSAFSSDVLRGLLYVERMTETHKIRVVNMSLGGGKFEAACDDDSPLTDVINRLTASGIAVVVASGNEKLVGAIAHPACISKVIAVGATTKKGEIDTRYSNVSAQVKIVAPGTEIVSSLGPAYGKLSGTSMASPHVAGLFALLKMQAPNASVADMLEAITKTGKSVKDNRSNQSFPFPNAKAAVAALVRPQADGGQPRQPDAPKTPDAPKAPDTPKTPEPPKAGQPQPGTPDCGGVCMEVGNDRRRFIFALANTRQSISPDVLAALKVLFGDGARVEPLGDGKLLVDVPAGAAQRDIDDARRKLGGDGVRILPDRPMQPLEPGGRLIIR